MGKQEDKSQDLNINTQMQDLIDAQMVKIGQASQILGVSIDTLRRWEKAGKIEAVRTPGGTRLYSLALLSQLQNKEIQIEQKKLHISQAAQKLGLSVKTLRRWDHSGKLPAQRDEHGERVYTTGQISNLSRQNFKSPITHIEKVIEKLPGNAFLMPKWLAKTALTLTTLTALIVFFLTAGYFFFPKQTLLLTSTNQPEKTQLSSTNRKPQVSIQQGQVLGIETGPLSLLQQAGTIALFPFNALSEKLIQTFSPKSAANLGFTSHEQSQDKQISQTQSQANNLAQNANILQTTVNSLTDLLNNSQASFSGQIQNLHSLTKIVNTNGTNLLRNSSFEANSSDQPQSWFYTNQSTSDNTFVNNQAVRTGNLALRIKPQGVSNTGTATNFGIYQPFFVTTAGKQYTLSAYLNNQSGQTVTLRLSFWDKNNKKTALSQTFPVSSYKDWQRYIFSLDPPSQGVDGNEYFPMIEILGQSQGNVFLDDIELSEGSASPVYVQNNTNLGDNSVFADANANIYPALNKNGSLGMDSNRFGSLYLTGGSIDSSGNTTLKGDVTINGTLTAGGTATFNNGTLNSSATSYNLLNTTVTTLNIGGAATAISIGAATGTTTINNTLAITGSTTFADGTVSSPGITFTNDTDTGIYRSGANTLDFSSGGVRTLSLNTATSGVNYLSFTPAATGSGPTITAAGSDTNIGLTINSKAAGALTLDSTTTGTVNLASGNNAKTINIGTGTAGNTINIGTNNTTADTITLGSALDSLALSSTNWSITSGGTASFNGNATFGDTTADTITFTGHVASSILPTTDGGYDLGSSALRFNNLYVATINATGTNTSGQAAFTYQPTSSVIGQGSVWINPTTASAARPLLSVSVGGIEKARITTDGYLGLNGANDPGSTYIINAGTPFNVTTSGNLALTDSSTTASSKTISISKTGNITGTGYGLYSTVTGTSTTNVAGYFSATNGTSNYGLLVENGNVGVGTTTPTATLHVVGQCVAVGTKIRRRKRGKNGELLDDWEEVPVEDILHDDQILTLNDKTGQWETHSVEKTMDMGIQTVFRLETEGGKWIETTANHPYLVRENSSKAQKTRLSADSLTNSTIDTYAPGLSVISVSQKLKFVKSNSGPEGNRTPATRWVKVSQLKIGAEIATVDGWEKIVTIKEAGRVQTYDLQVEGTHNFVGNDIVAHNTYINSSTATGIALDIDANSLSSGSGLDISSTSTAAASNTQKGLNITLSGTNGTSAQTTYGAYISNTHAGTTSTNVGLYATATGGTTANYAAIFEAGNVGIGTTAPAGLLHVAGQCVTGDTLLKRRRKRKRKNGEWIDEWEDVRIDEIKTGDEILTLDEKTGQFIPSTVRNLMDMGLQEVFLLTTQSNLRIETTANHPYLTIEKGIKLDKKREIFEVDQSPRIEDLTSNSFIALANKKGGFALKLEASAKRKIFKNHYRQNRKLFGPTIFAYLIVETIQEFHLKVSKLKIDEEYAGYQRIIEGIIEQFDPIIHVEFASLGRSNSPAHKLAYQLFTKKKRPGSARISKDSRLQSGFTPGLTQKIHPPTRSLMTKDYHKFEDLSNAVWKQVTFLKPGDIIATVNGWQKISGKYSTGRKQTFDIEVEGTHNFVGNNIVAHNTAIFGAGEGGTPTATTLRGAAAAGTNIAGANFTFDASNGTGTGGSGALIFRTAPTGTTGTTANTLAEIMRITPGGNVGIGTTAPTQALYVARNITSPGGSQSEKFGYGSSASNSNSVAIGYNATAADSTSVVIGSGANTVNTSWSHDTVVIGYNASISSGYTSIVIGSGASIGSATESEIIGYQATSTGSCCAVAIGAHASVGYKSIVLGRYATDTADYQFVAGNTNGPINNVYFGKGVTDSSPTAYTINGTGGSGSNIAGGNLQLAGGQGTGTGTGGSLVFQTAPAGSSGSSANALVTRMTIDSTGNVGIGTTAPAGLLHVAGQCVTGDTLLKRRRKRKRKNGTEEDVWEDIAIKDIKPGDKILTLDETTGKFVPSKVKQLADMGIHKTFEIITETGKSIRTTANHPYLVWDDKTNLNFLQKDSFEYTEKNARKFYFENLAGRRVYSPIFKEYIHFTEEGWNHFVEKSRSINELITRFFALPRVAAVLAKTTVKPTYEKRVKPNLTAEYWIFNEIVEQVALRVVVCSIDKKPKFFLSCTWLGAKEEKGIQANKKELSLARILTGRRRRLVTSQLFNKLTLPENRKNVKWIKVAQLKAGQKIATVNGWERIISLKHIAREQVFDIEIENTHNFVGNNIVAHNTAIFGAGEGGTPTATTLRGAAAAGTNIAGANFTFDASNGTGTGGSGALIFRTAPTGTTGTTANTLAEIMRITPGGNVGIGTTAPAAQLDVLTAAASTGINLAGTAPVSIAGNGTSAATNTLAVVGTAGGASSGVTGQTGGTGGALSLTGGVGGAVAGASGIGGAGGGLTFAGGAGGNGAATGGAGGAISITAGAAGTGGNANGGTLTLNSGAVTGSGTSTINLGSSNTTNLNIGTASVADTITIGNATGATSLAFTSGTGSQTHTSSVVSGTTTTSANVFTDSALTTGTLSYLTSNSITTGKLLDIADTNNTWTGNGTTNGLINLASSSTAGTASSQSILLNLSRSGANAQLAHSAYGVYSTVTNTNTTSGTNIAGYFSASGATTANYGLIVANGNVGFGTSTPTATLHVVGQCVTGDTKLKRRKKKKNGEWSDQYEDVEIKDIKKGDQILSLNESTGEFEPHKINGLMNMGRQDVFELITKSKLKIRTTAEHPYLVLRSVKLPKLPQYTIFEVDPSIRVDDLGRDTFFAIANKQSNFVVKLSREEKQILSKHYQKMGTPNLFGPEVYARLIVQTIKKFDIKATTLVIDREYSANYDKKIAEIIENNLPQLSIHFGSVGKHSPAHLAANKERLSLGKKVESQARSNLQGFRAAELLHPETSSAIRSPLSLLTGKNYNTEWVKVKYLKPGMTIATINGWEKISNIIHRGKEQTYDIEVENTHNFVGNNIVAHNTYINSSTATGIALDIDANSLSSGSALDISSTSTAAASNTQTGLNIAMSGTNATSAQTTYGLQSSNTHAGTGAVNVGGLFTATGGLTNRGLEVAAMTGATSTGLTIGALSGTTANTGVSIGAISGTGATGTGITVGNISSTGTTNYGLLLGTMTGGTTSNYQISTGVLTSATTTTNAQINLGGVVTTGGTTNYGINVGALSGTGTTNYGVNINTLTSTGTTNYGLNVGGATGAATTNYGVFIGAVSGASTNISLAFQKENAHTIQIVDSTTSNTAGGALTIKSGAGLGTTATAAGGALSLASGAGGALSATASTAGAGGAFSITGGVGGATSGAVTGSTVGGIGGGLTFTAGAGGAATGGTVANTAGAGGAISLVGGAAGAASGTGPVGAAGGAVSLTGGAGNLAGAGGAMSLTAGQGGATGTGGAITLTTGAGGSTSGNSGNLTLDVGTVTSGTKGTISVGTTNASALSLGNSSSTLTLTSSGTLTGTTLTTVSLGTSATINAAATGLNLQADGTVDVNIAGGSGATGCTVANSTGNLTCSGNITGSSSGTVGFWSRSSTTLSPATANDIVSIANTTTTGADLAITNTGVYTGTGIFNLTANSATTGNLANISANGLTTGNALAISSTSIAGGASGNSYLLNLSRSGTNAQLAHSAYGVYSTVTNTNTTSGTNIAGYFSASGATTANYGLIVANGNVGFGTSTPTATLHVVGQCVTGDTKLKRRRRRKGKNGEWEDYWEDVEIKDIKEGDEILTLDETLGEFVPQKVKALMDMGSQEVFRLVTQFGKTIETTGNHPYLTIVKDILKDQRPQRLTTFEVDQSMRIEDKTADTILAIANKESSFLGKLDKKQKLALYLQYSKQNRPKIFGPEIFAKMIVATINKFDLKVTRLIIDREYSEGYDAVITTTIEAAYPDIIINFKSVGKHSPAHIAAFTAHINRNIKKNKKEEVVANSILKGFLASELLHQAFTRIRSPHYLLLKSNYITKWEKVNQLKQGDIIATVDGWEKISAKYSTGRKQTWDIEVEGTHNFVGNDIVAHNTYINSSTATGIALDIDANSLSSGSGLDISSTSTAAASNTQKGLNIALSGTNTTSAQTTYGAYISNTHAGTTSTNVGLYATASGGTTANYAAIFEAGNVGIGTTAPTNKLHLWTNSGSIGQNIQTTDSGSPGSNTASLQFTNPGTGSVVIGREAGNGGQLISGSTTSSGYAGVVNVSGPYSLQFGTNNIVRTTIDSNGNVGIGTTSPTAQLQVNAGADARPLLTLYDDAATPSKLFEFTNPTGAMVNGFSFIPAATLSAPAITAQGSDTNIGLSINSKGTGTVALTSANATGTTTTSAFTLTDNSLTSGTGAYFTSSSITTGKLVDISNTSNTQTSGTLFNVSSTATSLTGTANSGAGLLANLDWSPGSAVTATGDLFRINIGTNGTTTGSLFNITDTNSSIFAVSKNAVTTSLPFSDTASGDLSIAYDINMTNPTASFIKSAAPLYLVAGETFNSSNLTLQTYNQGSVVIDSAQTTGNAVDITNSTLTTGNILGITETSTAGGASGSSYILNIAKSGANAAATHTSYGIASSVTNSGTTSVNYGGLFTATGATTNYGLAVAAMTGATSTGLNIGALSGATANYGINIGNITSAATANNFGLKIGTITSQASATSYGISTGAISGAGTATYGINLGANSSTATTNYGINIGAISGAGTTNYGLYVGAVSGATNNYAAIFAGGNVGIGTTSPQATFSIAGGTTGNGRSDMALFWPTRWGFQQAASEQVSAGQIDYGSFDSTALSIVGKGTLSTNRLVRIFDAIGVNVAPSTNQALKVDGTNMTYSAVFTGGSVGIGTTAPTQTLEIGGNGLTNVLLANSDTGNPGAKLSIAGSLLTEQLNVAARTNMISSVSYYGSWTGWQTCTAGWATGCSVTTSTGNGFRGTAIRGSGTSSGHIAWATSGAQNAAFLVGKTYRVSFMYRSDVGLVVTDRDDALATVPANTGNAKYYSFTWTGASVVDPPTNGPCSNYGQVNSCFLVLGLSGSGYFEVGDLTVENLTDATPTYNMIADPYGNVGIGTTGPDSTLSINDPGTGAFSLKIRRTSAGGNVTGLRLVSNSGTGINYRWGDMQLLLPAGGTADGRLAFLVGNNATEGTGSVEAMSIQTNGNVGIGTSIPSYPFHVFGSSGSDIAAALRAGSTSRSPMLRFEDSGGTVRGYIGTDRATSGPLLITGSTANALNIQSAGDLFINNNNNAAGSTLISMIGGNVGIGITNPIARLDVQGTTARSGTTGTSPSFYVSGSLSDGATGPASGNIEFRHDNGTQGIGFGYNTIYQTGSNTNNALNLLSRGTSPITLNAYSYSTGNVGIGTTGPISKFQVTSASGSTNNSRFTTNDFVLSSAGSELLLDFGASSGNTYSRLSALSAGEGAWNNLILQSGGGNVGIGTATPKQPGGLQLSNTASGYGMITSVGGSYFSANAYYDTSWHYIGVNKASTITSNTDGGIYFYTTDTTGAADGALTFSQRVKIDSVGNMVIGTAALATTATNGFLYIPTSAGAPTGVPTTEIGTVALEYDTTNNKLMIYNGGWKTTTGFADYSEWAPAANTDSGDIVTVTTDPNPVNDPTAPFMLGKTTSAYDTKVVGVISQYAEDAQMAYGYKKSADYHAVALVGRVPVKVSTENGPIQKGDYLTSSSTPGVAMKATKAGPTIGKALENYNGLGVGKILVFVNVSYADPGAALTNLLLDNDGSLIVPKLKSNQLLISAGVNITPLQLNNNLVYQTTLTSTGDTAYNIDVAGSLSKISDKLDQLDLFKTKQATDSAQLAQEVASQSATIAQTKSTTLTLAQQLASAAASLAQTKSDVDSLKLTPPDILLASGSATLANLTVSADATISGKLASYDLSVSNIFKSLGKAILGDTTVAGDITQDGTFSITSGNSINVAGVPTNLTNSTNGILFLQNSNLAQGLDILAGKFTFDTSGKLTVAGEVQAKQFSVSTTTTADNSTGTGIIATGSTGATITNSLAKANSIILITPKIALNQTLAVTQKADGSFTVSLARPETTNIQFDYLIIGVE